LKSRETYSQDNGAQNKLPRSVSPRVTRCCTGAAPLRASQANRTWLRCLAVIGEIFWPSAVTAPGAGTSSGEMDEGELQEHLHELERRQFIRRERASSLAGETQCAFMHVLVRDVAYGQIPRAARASKHIQAAGWIESLGRP
jgi:hypothetical protein